MYDELLKALRGCVLSEPCEGCPYYDPAGQTEKCATLNIAAADAIEELMRRCEQFQYMPPPAWIPVTERRAEFPCICYDANGNMPFIPHGILTIKDDQGVWQISADLADPILHQGKNKPVLGYGNRITNWMPLPEPPKEEDHV